MLYPGALTVFGPHSCASTSMLRRDPKVDLSLGQTRTAGPCSDVISKAKGCIHFRIRGKADLSHRIAFFASPFFQAAKLLGVDQPKISALARGRFADFSIDRLLRFLVLLGHDVKITVKYRSRARARLLVA
jgi:hypothetical protein